MYVQRETRVVRELCLLLDLMKTVICDLPTHIIDSFNYLSDLLKRQLWFHGVDQDEDHLG